MDKADQTVLRPGDVLYVPTTTQSLCFSYPLRGDFLAQLVVPRNLTATEAKRLCAFIETLPIPDSAGAPTK